MNGVFNINFNDIDLLVKYYYDKGEPTIYYYPDGSGFPGTDPSVEIYSIELQGIDIIELIDQSIISKLEEQILSTF